MSLLRYPQITLRWRWTIRIGEAGQRAQVRDEEGTPNCVATISVCVCRCSFLPFSVLFIFLGCLLRCYNAVETLVFFSFSRCWIGVGPDHTSFGCSYCAHGDLCLKTLNSLLDKTSLPHFMPMHNIKLSYLVDPCVLRPMDQ